MGKTLVVVESPAKARTIARYLGDDYVVESSIGHIRDLPKRAGDIPAKYKKEEWARLGVDIENDFKPLYVVDADKKEQVKKLKNLLADSEQLLLATDEDREGESIAWHLLEVLKPKVPYQRMVFHEITKTAIRHAVEQPRDLDRRLVDAQEARRILDRLYGYKVSPVLWKKIMPKLSAGRVQSVATRVIVERERARMRFTAAEYWGLDGKFEQTGDKSGKLTAGLSSIDDARLATGKDFDENGKLKSDQVVALDERAVKDLVAKLDGSEFRVAKVEKKPYRRSPAAPFMTSTLQQEAGRKLRFGAQRTMRLAQRLYELGFITYMRTDSTTLSSDALNTARKQIRDMYGEDYLPAKPRQYANKVKNAQEAHEAIRPSGDTFRTPDVVAREVGPDEAKLYELIWKRTVASQMNEARGQRMQVRIAATASDGRRVELSVSGLTITFPGFLRAYVEGSDDPEAELEDRERPLPPLEEGDLLKALGFEPQQHETQPPARFTEASLVRRLEELGVGRPSTYASIISTIQARGYVWKKGSALVPSFKAFAVVQLLEKHFPSLVDYAFTARMEDELDAIAGGDERAIPWLRRFYFGDDAKDDDEGLHSLVADQLDEIDAREINTVPIGTDDEGRDIVARVGRYGPYLQRGDDSVSLPEDLPPDELTVEKASELLNAPSGDRELGVDPETGLPVFVRAGRYGAYIQLGDAGEGKEKPKTASVFRSMEPEKLTLDEALKLLSLPRVVGKDPGDGEEIKAQNGRYGPYITKGKESRSLETEEQIFTVTVDDALKLLAQPKRRGRRERPPLRELGADPVSGEAVTVREGRFGPYVTDGETMASLRTGDTIEGVTLERAAELIQARRERGPSKKKRSKKTASKKKSAKTSSRKKSAKKTASKKSAKKSARKKKSSKKKAAKKSAKKASSKNSSEDNGEAKSGGSGRSSRGSAGGETHAEP